jgi:vacuolar-type H+-ATPase subunit E/Vma4
MTVEQTNVIDVLGIDNSSGKVVLTISDHLDWTDEEHHLLTLQEKLNKYLSFVESGELVEIYPDSNGRDVIIEIFLEHSFPETVKDFFHQVSTIIESAGFEFKISTISSPSTSSPDRRVR